MSNYVKIDIVIRAIKQHNYVVYYMRDANNNLQFYNTDIAANADNVINEIQELIPFCTGQFVNIELRKLPIGDAEKGGNNTTASMKFKVLLNNGTEALKPQQPAAGSIPGMPSIYELFQTNLNLQQKMFEMQFEQKLEGIKRERDEYKEKANSPLVDKAVDKIFEKWIAADDASNAVKKAVKNNEVPAAPLADENKITGKAAEVKTALAELKAVDPDIADNLIFLAQYAKKNPVIYKELVKNLKETNGTT